MEDASACGGLDPINADQVPVLSFVFPSTSKFGRRPHVDFPPLQALQRGDVVDASTQRPASVDVPR